MNASDFDRGLWTYRARPLRTIDGDTFVCELDLGCFVRFEAHIRIAGLNAPERSEAGGPVATAMLRRTLNEIPIAQERYGWPLRIVSKQRETVVDQVRSFERLVCDCFIAQPDGSLRDLKEAIH